MNRLAFQSWHIVSHWAAVTHSRNVEAHSEGQPGGTLTQEPSVLASAFRGKATVVGSALDFTWLESVVRERRRWSCRRHATLSPGPVRGHLPKPGETPWHSGCESSVGKRVRQIAQLFFLNCIKLGNNSTFLNLFLVMPFMPVKMVNFYFSMKNWITSFCALYKNLSKSFFKAGEDLGGCLFLEQPYCGLYTVLVNFNHLLVGLHFILFVIWQRTHRLAGSKPALLSVVPS